MRKDKAPGKSARCGVHTGFQQLKSLCLLPYRRVPHGRAPLGLGAHRHGSAGSRPCSEFQLPDQHSFRIRRQNLVQFLLTKFGVNVIPKRYTAGAGFRRAREFKL